MPSTHASFDKLLDESSILLMLAFCMTWHQRHCMHGHTISLSVGQKLPCKVQLCAAKTAASRDQRACWNSQQGSMKGYCPAEDRMRRGVCTVQTSRHTCQGHSPCQQHTPPQTWDCTALHQPPALLPCAPMGAGSECTHHSCEQFHCAAAPPDS